MTAPRFSLKSMILATAFLAAIFASLAEPWRGWCPSVVLTAAVVMLLLALPAAIYAPLSSRPYYVGFAAAGWGYLLLAFSPWFASHVGRQMIAGPLAEWLCFEATGSLADWEQFLKVTHAACLVVFSLAGGVTASRFHAAGMLERAAGDERGPFTLNSQSSPAAHSTDRLQRRPSSPLARSQPT